MGPTWGPSGADRTQVGPMLAPWTFVIWGKTRPGPRFNIKMPSYQYMKSHCGDKTILRPSHHYNGISYTGKMISSYWIGAQKIVPVEWFGEIRENRTNAFKWRVYGSVRFRVFVCVRAETLFHWKSLLRWKKTTRVHFEFNSWIFNSKRVALLKPPKDSRCWTLGLQHVTLLDYVEAKCE